MAWLQFSMPLPGDDPGSTEDALLSVGALSVTLSDDADEPVLEPALGETPLWSQTRITALFDGDTDPEILIAAIANELGELADYTLETLEDREWEREWEKDFQPMRFGRRLWIAPGDAAVADEDAVVIRLDPGLAFGTGTHATTAMCLDWLDAQDVDRASVLDYGCGSGILAIAALKLGARSACGVDIDPQALLATADNAARNGVDVPCFGVGQVPEGPFDVVLANILAGPLVELATQLSEYVKTGGRLALSGILEEQAASVRKAYEPFIVFDTNETMFQDGQTWVRLSGTRRTT